MIITGHVKNNVIILDNPIKLPDGVKVKIMLSDKSITRPSGLCGIWEDDRTGEQIVNEIISSRTIGRNIKL